MPDRVTRGRQTTHVMPYTDPVEGFSGYLAYCGDRHRLAAGGFRVRTPLRGETIAALAETMLLKERLLGLAVDGAKAGIDYDPASPGKRAAMRRFLRFLRPHLLERLSLGPDLGTKWGEIEAAASEEGITSVKMAVARAQGLEEWDFRQRLQVLNQPVDGRTVGQRRAGHALAHAALAACDAAGTAPEGARVGIQGFGTLGRGAAYSLDQAGARVVAVADEHGSLLCDDGLDVASLSARPHGDTVVRGPAAGAFAGPPAEIFRRPLDVVVLAACERGLSEAQASSLAARAVVVGANLGLAPEVERLLHRRGVLVVPDFVAGCGGSASMDVLFGSPTCPTPPQVLEEVGIRMQQLVREVVGLAHRRGVTTRQAAHELAEARPDLAGERPYGHWARSHAAPAGGAGPFAS